MSRRALLRSAGALAVGSAALAGVGLSASACTAGGKDEPDPLVALHADAVSDAALATALLPVHPDLSAQLHTIATERRAHASALDAEIRRAAGGRQDTAEETEQTNAPGSSATGHAPTGPPPALDALRTALASARTSASAAARSLSGYRAGLTGSIAAACAAEKKVLLP